MRFIAIQLLSLLFLGAVLPMTASAQQSKRGTSDEMAWATGWNRRLQKTFTDKQSNVYRPVGEYEHYKYLLMSSDESFNSGEFKKTLTQNLPEDITLVLLTTPRAAADVRKKYAKWINPSRLIIATHETAPSGFWSRDAFPYPVFSNANKNVRLVWARYFRKFEAGNALADAVRGSVERQPHYFVGGNLMADENAQCFVVESERLFELTDETLRDIYGCNAVLRFPHVEGIGDVDEVVKVLPGKKALTTIASYAPMLQEIGYEVEMLPRLTNYRTYANSIILNGTVFMPSFRNSQDEQAKSAYEKFGYKVILADSETLSTAGLGSFHCTTMAYPDMSVDILLSSLGAQRSDGERTRH